MGFLTTGVIWGFLVKGVNLVGFDLGGKLWGFLTVGVYFGGFNQGRSFGAFLEKFVILTPTSGVRPQ